MTVQTRQDRAGRTGTAIEVYRSVSEASWQATVVEAAMRLGWRCHFLPDGVWNALYERYKRRGRPTGVNLASSGFPDLVMAHAAFGRVIFAELKSEAGRVRPEQQQWLDDLAACGVETYTWKPHQIDDVIAVLSGDQS